MGLPVNTLVAVTGSAAPQHAPRKATCDTGDLILIKGSDGSLPFFVGLLIEMLTPNNALVPWLVPQESRQTNFRAGRKKLVTDIYACWHAADKQALATLPVLPPVEVQPEQILEWAFELEDDMVPFSVLDRVVDVHFIDITGLSLSSTPRGNLFRTHRLMRNAC